VCLIFTALHNKVLSHDFALISHDFALKCSSYYHADIFHTFTSSWLVGYVECALIFLTPNFKKFREAKKTYWMRTLAQMHSGAQNHANPMFEPICFFQKHLVHAPSNTVQYHGF
jgi:hypothetical protein